MQLPDPAALENEPAAHGAHTVAPPGEYWPAPHTLQDVDADALVNWPGGHVAHDPDIADAAYVPTLQFAHGVAPPLLY